MHTKYRSCQNVMTVEVAFVKVKEMVIAMLLSKVSGGQWSSIGIFYNVCEFVSCPTNSCSNIHFASFKWSISNFSPHLDYPGAQTVIDLHQKLMQARLSSFSTYRYWNLVCSSAKTGGVNQQAFTKAAPSMIIKDKNKHIHYLEAQATKLILKWFVC